MPATDTIEILTKEELALRLKVKVSWINENSKPSRTGDPIPITRFGKHKRFAWGSRRFQAWLDRRISS